MEILEALKYYFGYDSFRPGQEEIINSIIQKECVLAILPTGGGKSLCFQIPALINKSFSIVISPLIALMKDQADALNKKSRQAAFINSTLDFRQTEEVLNLIANGELKLLYLAPERLDNINFADRIKNVNPAYLFIDEAHCISEWGHNFRPSYRKIKEFADYINIKNISAFTATATPEVVEDIVKQLGMSNPIIFVKGFERTNLSIKVQRVKKKKDKCLEAINQFGSPAIIYTSSRKKTEEVAEFLQLYGFNAAYYHAGMANEERKHIQELFLDDQVKIIVATSAFGMGIDKKDIRLVIHYNMPPSIENYYQEIGRAGRDGLDSTAVLLYNERDKDIHNYFISTSNPSKENIKEIYNAICDFGKIAVGSITQSEIPITNDYIKLYLKQEINPAFIESALNILETAGYISRISPFEKKFSFRFNYDQNSLKRTIKNISDNEIKDVLLLLVREYGSTAFNSPISFSLTNLQDKFEIPADQIDEIMTRLGNGGIIEYNKPLRERSVKLKVPRVQEKNLIIDYKKLSDNYQNSLRKLDKVIEFVYSDECRMKFLINYFGDETNDYQCCKCDICLGNKQNDKDSYSYVAELFLRTIYESKGKPTEKRLLNILKGNIGKEYSTYGSLANYSEDELFQTFERMLSEKLISKEASGNKIVLEKNGQDILDKLGLVAPVEEIIKQDYEENLELFNLLRIARNEAAEKFQQPAYLICTDEVLRKIAESKPETNSQLLSVEGFNQRAFTKAGEEFLEVIIEFVDKQKDKSSAAEIPQNISETYNLILKGYRLSEIASLRNLSEAVISMQVETILEYKPDTNINKLIDKENILQIEELLAAGHKDLKTIKENLKRDVPYPEIRVVLAKNKFNAS
ncbi:MAG: RecQ family ATP-dependent DNA helicase [Ignavibacteriales bacterium]|nr:MAG: RecQ family ATP-dependent DNA helicase [Ignavibacteriales bacterium]